MENITIVNEFLLLELTQVQELQPVIFITFLIIYMINLFGNEDILVVIISEPRLHSPMYFFLGNHFFCHVKPPLELACGDVSLKWLIFIVTCSLAMVAFFLTLLSYFYVIGFLLLKHWSCSALCKALSTCASHFIVVFLFYGTVGLTYILPSSAASIIQERFMAVIHMTVTPVLNPLICTFRNKEGMSALSRVFRRKLKLLS